MGRFSKHGWLRRGFRYTRWAVAGAFLLLIGAAAYLNYFGAPAFVKARIEAELSKRGFEAAFSDLRVSRWRELVLRDLTLERAGTLNSPRLTGSNAVVSLDPWAVFGGSFFQNISLESGTLEWPFYDQDQPPFTVTNIQVEIGALPERDWSFGSLRGKTRGLDFALTAAVKPPGGERRPKAPQELREDWGRWARQIGQALERVQQFDAPRGGILRVSFEGNLDQIDSLKTTLRFEAPLASTGSTVWSNVAIRAHVAPATNHQELKAEAAFSAEAGNFHGSSAERLRLAVRSTYPLTSNGVFGAEADLSARVFRAAWGEVEGFSAAVGSFADATASRMVHTAAFTGDLLSFGDAVITSPRARVKASHEAPEALMRSHNLAEQTIRRFRFLSELPSELPTITNTFTGELSLDARSAKTPRFQTGPASVTLRFSPVSEPLQSDPSLAWWNGLLPWRLEAGVAAEGLRVTNIVVDEFTGALSWSAPGLTLSNAQAGLAGKILKADATLDIVTRSVSAVTEFDIDVKRLQPLLSPSAQRWLNQYTWESPPLAAGKANLTLPPWTEKSRDWERLVLPTMTLAGSVQGGPGAFKGAGADHVEVDVRFSDLQWHLPRLIITRPEGTTRAEYWNDVKTREYWWKLNGRLDPRAIAPLLEPPERKPLEFFEFSQAPEFQAEISGRWGRPDSVAFNATVGLSNVAFRAQPAKSVRASLSFTNSALRARNIDVIGAEGHATIPELLYDIPRKRIFITNGFSTLDPMKVARALGPFAVRAIEDYVFHSPPTVRVNGWVPADDDAEADVVFDVGGGPFHYWKFNVPHVEARLIWKGDDLAVREARGPFYEGSFQFSGDFHFPDEKDSADFKFTSYVQAAELSDFVRDVLQKTNRMAGKTDALLVVTNANSDDLKSWSGYGQASLTNGFLWDVPVFGFFSPMFDAVSPGLGRSEIKSASMTFMLTNSVLHTRDLELRSDAFRLHYNGSVDFDANVRATVEAELFRDTFLFGRIFSAALWPVRKMFEYRVGGTLNEPKSEPVFIPKWLLAPFRARKIISDLEAKSITARWRKQQREMREANERARELEKANRAEDADEN